MGAGALSGVEHTLQGDNNFKDLLTISTNSRRRLAALPPSKLLSIARTVESEHPTRRPFSPLLTLPSACQYCPATTIFLTQQDHRFHFRDNHSPTILKLLDDDKTTNKNVLLRSLTFCHPGDIIDLSITCKWMYVTCESSILFPPWGKGVLSRIRKTMIVSTRASTLAKVTGLVMQETGSKLRIAKNQLTSLVEGNRIHLLKVKRPNAAQYTTASAVLALVGGSGGSDIAGSDNDYMTMTTDQRSPDYDSFRRLRQIMLKQGAEIPFIETTLANVDILTINPSSMLQARIYIETLKKQLQQHHGLNPQKYVQDIPGLPSNRVDLWTTVVGKWLIQFNHFWHCANFCIAANDKLTGTMLALQKSNAMLDRLSEIEPKWMACVAAMHGDPTRKQRALVDNEHLKEAFKQRQDKLDRLTAAGYPEFHGHWNLHELLEVHSGDWKHVLSRLQDMHPPVPPEEEDGVF